jgi:hypothetical protein
MPLSKPDEEALVDEGPESDEPLGTRAELEARGDAAGLRELAMAHRGGTRGAAKDMKACFDCYEAAAKLGDTESAYALALFLFAGIVVPADAKSGVTYLRAAADGGSLAARVYLANLYELGIHYKADKDKASVWYRSAARAENLDDESPEFAQKMAELGCVRHALPIMEAKATPEAQREALLRKVKARGYSLKLRESRDSMPVQPPAVGETKAEQKPAASPAEPPKRAAEKPKPKAKRSNVSVASGLRAFALTLVFAVAALAAGYLVGEGAKALYQARGALPLIGHRVAMVFPVVTGTILVLASLLVYRMRVVVAALAAGLLAAALLLHMRESREIVAASVGVYVGVLLLAGLFGGTKKLSSA